VIGSVRAGPANGVGGLVSDLCVRKFGLKTGRRAVGVLGLGTAAIFNGATIVATQQHWVSEFLSLAYAGILFQQPSLCAVCVDIGRINAGALFAS